MGKITTRVLIGLLSLNAFAPMLYAQHSSAEQLQQRDPNGIVLTLTAVSVVFVALLLLVFVFQAIGSALQRINQQKEAKTIVKHGVTSQEKISLSEEEVAVAIALSLSKEKAKLSDETIVAITMAIHSYLETNSHDLESYKLTIRHRPTLWNYKGQSLRKYP